MAQRKRAVKIDSPTSRAELEPRKTPYWKPLSVGRAIGYAKGKRGGSWVASAHIKQATPARRQTVLGTADDHLPADGLQVFSYDQAFKKALTWFEDELRRAKGLDVPTGPFTIGDACKDYLADFELRSKKSLQGTRATIQAHILPKLGKIEVNDLTPTRIEKWLAELVSLPARARTRKGEPQQYRALRTDEESKRRRMSTCNRVYTILKAILMGGRSASYHEIIVSPSESECRTILGRSPSNHSRAAEESGHRLARAYANGRPYLLAIHEQDGRFHFHIAVRGAMSEQALGRHGSMQKLWDRELFGDEPRIRDWEAHKRFLGEKARLQEIIREQKENERQRWEAVKRAEPRRKAEAARPFERKARLLIERRCLTELAALRARYESRGMLGSPRHKAELEQVEHRRTGALRRLEKREASRELGVAKARLGRAMDLGGRVAQRGTRVAGRVSRQVLDRTMKELGVPAPLRKVSRAGLVLAQEAAQAYGTRGTLWAVQRY